VKAEFFLEEVAKGLAMGPAMKVKEQFALLLDLQNPSPTPSPLLLK
jgi:hypothetical protein